MHLRAVRGAVKPYLKMGVGKGGQGSIASSVRNIGIETVMWIGKKDMRLRDRYTADLCYHYRNVGMNARPKLKTNQIYFVYTKGSLI